MTEWKEYYLDEICLDIIDCVNKTAPLSDSPTEYKMLRTSDIRNGNINLEGLNTVTQDTYEKWSRRGKLQVGDIVFTREAPLGEVGLVRQADNIFLGQRLVLFRADPNKCDNLFLLYALMFHDNKQAIIAKGVGSTVLHLRVPECGKIKIKAPELHIQKQIGQILSRYDDLIANHQQQIKLLEEAAQRLYKEWFVDLRFPGWEKAEIVDGVPKGGERVSLDYAVEFNPRITLPKDKLKIVVPMSALSTSSMVLDSTQFTETKSNSGTKFNNDDTLLARITPCLENGKTAYVSGMPEMGAVGSTEFIVMRSRKLNPQMVYLLARTEKFRQYAINSMTGADGRQRVQVDKLAMLQYVLPGQEIIDKFGDVVKPLFQQIQNKQNQIGLLQEARDRLLPKLISGEIEVSS